MGTDHSTGKRSSLAGQWPGAVVGFVFNNLLFKAFFESSSDYRESSFLENLIVMVTGV